MNWPRLGVSVVVNNLGPAAPGARADADALRRAHETLGFDVFCYDDVTTQVRA